MNEPLPRRTFIQVAALRKHGAGKVVHEVANGAKIDRAQLRRVLDELEAGDVLMRLSRRTRSSSDGYPGSIPCAL